MGLRKRLLTSDSLVMEGSGLNLITVGLMCLYIILVTLIISSYLANSQILKSLSGYSLSNLYYTFA